MGDLPPTPTLASTVEVALFDSIRTRCFMIINNCLRGHDGHMTMGFVDMITAKNESEWVCTCSAPITWSEHAREVSTVILELVTDLNRSVRELYSYGAFVALHEDDDYEDRGSETHLIVQIQCTVPIARTETV